MSRKKFPAVSDEPNVLPEDEPVKERLKDQGLGWDWNLRGLCRFTLQESLQGLGRLCDSDALD